VQQTSSPWRSQIFEASPQRDSVYLPLAPEAVLSLVLVDLSLTKFCVHREFPAFVGHLIYGKTANLKY